MYGQKLKKKNNKNRKEHGNDEKNLNARTKKENGRIITKNTKISYRRNKK